MNRNRPNSPRRRYSHRRGILGKPLLVLGGAVMAGLASGLLSLMPMKEKEADSPPPRSSQSKDNISLHFTLCKNGGGSNCVVDGDTIRLARQRIRIADIDTPETNPPRCDKEAELGKRATKRMQELLNKAPFSVEQYGSRTEDRYGRQLRIITRNGSSLGDVLVQEGLARHYNGGRRPWC